MVVIEVSKYSFTDSPNSLVSIAGPGLQHLPVHDVYATISSERMLVASQR